MHNSTQSSITEESCQRCVDHSRNFTSTEKQTQTHDEKTSTAQSNVQSHGHELLSSIQPTSPHKTLCGLNYTQLNLLLPPTWLTLTLCPSTQHHRLADWSRDCHAGAAHVTSGNTGARDNARKNARCTKARKATHGLDGQHQYVDKTPRGRFNQNGRGQG